MKSRSRRALIVLALGVAPTMPAARAQEPPPAREPGLSVRVYDVDDAPMDRLLLLVPGQTPNASFVAPVLDLRGERGDFGDIQDTFVTTVEGFFTVAEPGRYEFRLTSDDGSTLSIDWHDVVNADGLHSAVPVDGAADLATGEHTLLIRHFEYGGGEQLTLEWKPPGAAEFTLVPASALACQAGEVRVTSPGIKQLIHPLARGRPGDGLPLDTVHPGYDLMTVRPEGFEPKVGGMDFLPDGRLAICTWDADGAVWLLSGVQGNDRAAITAHRLAAGLAEPLGLCVVDNRIFVLQKQELTEILDHDNDGIADEYRCVCNDWTVSSNFHEFAFGLVHADGAFWANLAIAIDPGGKSTEVQAAERGSLVRITEGRHEIIATGLRAPNGIGLGPVLGPASTDAFGNPVIRHADADMPPIFLTDNQGDWLPVSKLLRAQRGAFYGSRAVRTLSKAEAVKAALQPDEDADRDWPAMTPPVVWLPQGEIGNSPSQPTLVHDAPFDGQILLGDVTYGGLQRVFVEELDGVAQGCVFRFTQGLEAGINRLCWGLDGALYVGGIGSTGNWGQEGKERFGLQRLRRNGRRVFEMLAVRAMSNGLQIEFTTPLAAGLGWDPEEYFVEQWRYEPTSDYGGEKLDLVELPARSASVSDDRRRVFIELPGMAEGHVLHLRLADALRAEPDKGHTLGAQDAARTRIENGARLWTTEGWYTLNRIPADRNGKVDPSPLLRTPNALLSAERAVGWKLLFDGKSFAGWHRFGTPPSSGAADSAAGGAETAGGGNAAGGAGTVGGTSAAATSGAAPAGWEVIDGAITHVRSGGDIATDEAFADFELELEWRISPGGNSGIMYRVTEDHSLAWETGPEMQVLDNTRHADGMNPLTSAGSCYALHAPPRDNTRPVGRWNRARLVVQGNHVEHWLNGERLVAYELHSPEWKALVAASKFNAMPDYGSRNAGVLVLQDHGDAVRYRNIRIRSLKPR